MVRADTSRGRVSWTVSGTAIAAALAVALCAGAYFRYRSSAERLHEAESQLAECEKLVREIRRLESVPTLAALGADSNRTIARRIEAALERSKLPEDAVLRILPPAQPFRLGETPYEVYATRIELKQVTLRQLVVFAHALHDGSRGMTVRDLRLWTPRGVANSTPERWSAELTLTQLAFSPKTR